MTIKISIYSDNRYFNLFQRFLGNLVIKDSSKSDKKFEFLSFQEKENFFCENTRDYASDINGKTLYSINRTEDKKYKSIDFNDNTIFYRYTEIGNPKGTDCRVDIYKRIDIKCPNQSVLDELLQECYKYKFYSRYPDKINIFKWYSSYWDKFNVMNKRDINTIYLDKKILDHFVNDLDVFTNSKSKYEKYCIPYKRNYLLSGLPGTGKTSLIKSIASKLDYSIYIIPFTGNLDDMALSEAISNIPEKCILLIEDVDSLFVKRENKSSSLTFSGMINALDGITVKHGLITFLTTNHIKHIDDALLRPGRIDYHLEFTYTTDEQKKIMCKHFLESNTDDDITKFIDKTQNIKITTAILQHFLFEFENKCIYDKKAVKRLRFLSQKYVKNDSSNSLYN